MLFCDYEYREKILETLNISWADSLDALLTVCRIARVSEDLKLAAFFFSVRSRREYVLGPHWGIEAPLIRGRVSEHPWKLLENDSLEIPPPWKLSEDHFLHLLPLSSDLVFAAVTDVDRGGAPIFTAEAQDCWRSLQGIIPRKDFDLSPAAASSRALSADGNQ
ncbi:hypothetical protein [Salinispira pacifica]|uniref:hypothetical protein n=1 Tax=Salinispira pacifica TaxID=1307761 RepID=UPI00059DC55F|nr:hypothetical protein [Salinispira pacifica]